MFEAIQPEYFGQAPLRFTRALLLCHRCQDIYQFNAVLIHGDTLVHLEPIRRWITNLIRNQLLPHKELDAVTNNLVIAAFNAIITHRTDPRDRSGGDCNDKPAEHGTI